MAGFSYPGLRYGDACELSKQAIGNDFSRKKKDPINARVCVAYGLCVIIARGIGRPVVRFPIT